jgi:hypothetical protein
MQPLAPPRSFPLKGGRLGWGSATSRIARVEKTLPTKAGEVEGTYDCDAERVAAACGGRSLSRTTTTMRLISPLR